ncbi:hypothetical protein IQ218_10315 [Synechocystis salina LEGE 06099]|uniref:hypothetical protein n=1 Tax=Synechocystis salina TaxID=945780 RepID=UPI00188252AC|nr:hypothetical protein [Synechocystis salina]MBE9203756.1 hypothetical protein [Synechocystis salina LEGE 06099]
MAGSITVVVFVAVAHPQKVPAQEAVDEIPQSSLTAEIQASPQNELFLRMFWCGGNPFLKWEV